MGKTLDQQLKEMRELRISGKLEALPCEDYEQNADAAQLDVEVEKIKRLNPLPRAREGAKAARSIHRISVSAAAFKKLEKKAKQAKMEVGEYVEKLLMK